MQLLPYFCNRTEIKQVKWLFSDCIQSSREELRLSVNSEMFFCPPASDSVPLVTRSTNLLLKKWSHVLIAAWNQLRSWKPLSGSFSLRNSGAATSGCVIYVPLKRACCSASLSLQSNDWRFFHEEDFPFYLIKCAAIQLRTASLRLWLWIRFI